MLVLACNDANTAPKEMGCIDCASNLLFEKWNQDAMLNNINEVMHIQA